MGQWLRRRELLLPTLKGWALILILSFLIGFLAVHRVYDFLAKDQPLPGAEILIVEGWLSESELEQAIDLFSSGGYTMVLTTGGPIESWADLQGFSWYPDRAADYLIRGGVPAGRVHSLPASASRQNRTFLSAVAVRLWLEQQGPVLTRMNLLSAGVHARRSHRLFQLALGRNFRVGILPVTQTSFCPHAWWRSSEGAKAVLGELSSLAWTVCCFRAPERGSHQEL